MLPMLEEEARKRQGARVDLTSAPCGAEVENDGESYGKSARKAAEIVGSSSTSVFRAAYVKKRDPAMTPPTRARSGLIGVLVSVGVE